MEIKKTYTTSDKKIHLEMELSNYTIRNFIEYVDIETNEIITISTRQVEDIVTDIYITTSKISIMQFIVPEFNRQWDKTLCEIEIKPTDTIMRTIKINHWCISYFYDKDQLKVKFTTN